MASDVLVEEVYQYWNGSSSDNAFRYTTTYAPNQQMTGSVYYEWATAWDTVSLGSFTYSPQGNLEQELWQDLVGGLLENSELYSYAYDGNQRLIEEIIQWWVSGGWVDTFRFLSTYDGSGHLIEEIEQWVIVSSWRGLYRETFTYDGTGKVVAESSYTWAGSSWDINDFGVFSYDGTGYLISEEWFINSGPSWLPHEKYLYTNDPNGNVLVELWQTLTGSDYGDNGRGLHTWQSVTGVQENGSPVPEMWLSPNYPNPFNPSTQIEFTSRDPLSSPSASLMPWDERWASWKTASGARPACRGVGWIGLPERHVLLPAGIRRIRSDGEDGSSQASECDNWALRYSSLRKWPPRSPIV